MFDIDLSHASQNMFNTYHHHSRHHLSQHLHCASVWRPKRGAPVTLASSSDGRCSALGRRSTAPACLGSKSIKQIAVAFAIWKRVELLWAGFPTFQKRRILAPPIRGFAHTTCAAKCGLGAIEFGDATDLPLHPLPSEIAPCDKVDATDPTAFSTPLGEIHVGAWSILLLAWVRLPFWAHPHVVAMDCGVRECGRV